ncbi:MAG: non-ribosomal peptide synthetase, partial [Limisphaerales bacterium]
VQYADYALWQRERYDGGALADQLAYWKKQLSGELPILELPFDHPRPAHETHEGAKVKRAFSPDLSEKIREQARKEQVTPFIYLLAVFKCLLHRYTGQEDIIVGTPIAGRTRVETEDLIGFFVNTLALRSRVQADLSFRDYLAEVRTTILGAFANQDVPFEKLVEEIQPDRRSAENPIFNVMFAVHSGHEMAQMQGLELTVEEVETRTAKFDLTLVIQDAKEGLVAHLDFNCSLFEHGTANNLLTHLESLLEGIVVQPEQSIGTLPLLTMPEREKILHQWNRTGTEFPRDTPIHQLFARQVQVRPGEIAVAYGNESLTYLELHERSNQLANYLRKFGVGPDVLVGVCLERSVEMIVAWLGTLKAGGAYVPLDPGYPEERLQFMLEDTRMPVLITQKKLTNKVPNGAKKLCLDSEWGVVSRESKVMPLDNGVTSENLAYVIYTSGSTGKPKGAAVPHRAIARLVFNTNYIQLGPNDRIAQASNSSFDAATFEVWGSLLQGGKLIGVPQNVLLSPADLVKHLHEHSVSTIFLTTALFNQIAMEIPDAFCTIKNVLFGGEACDPKCVKMVLRHGPPQRLLHVYGPTETTTFASWFEIESVPDGATTIPIGRPLSNTTFYVLDKQRQPLPVGIPGELYIGGDGLARGYFNRPELTSAKFIQSPFETDERLYKTGDLVRYLRDGNIEFLGRIDNQVKIRGFRIELEEIEIALEQHPVVRDAVVIVRDNRSGKRLVAYVVAQDNPPAVEELRHFMKQKVPDFMVPSAFVFLPALPLTPNGKVDRRALPEPQMEKSNGSESDLPRNNLENQLAKIWERILGVKPIGIYDNFFELGGHSLMAVRLFTQIEKSMGQKLPLSTLFKAPTIEGLANVMRGKSWSA